MKQFEIKTMVCGNPDRGQNPNKPPYGVRAKTLRANTYAEIREMVQDWIGDNDIGGGNWMNPPLVFDGQVVGYMSYNGKVWADVSWTPDTKQITFTTEKENA
jgi:hypothetical protein